MSLISTEDIVAAKQRYMIYELSRIHHLAATIGGLYDTIASASSYLALL
jgi:hypothetical protein